MPLYHRPKPLPLLPAHGVILNSYFQKPVPFIPKPAAPRRIFRNLVTTKPEPVLYSSLLAGMAIGLLVFTGFALTLLMASLVWASPHRSWLLCGLFLAYLTFTFVTTRALGRRLRAWRPWADLQMRLRQDGQNLGNLLKSAHQGRMPHASDY